MPTIAVRLSDAERIELDNRAQGDISKYVRNALFGDAERSQRLETRMDELLETQTVLLSMFRTLATEVREPKAAPAQDNPRLEGMALELLLLLRGKVASRTELNAIQGEVERQGLPVWEDQLQDRFGMRANDKALIHERVTGRD
jgi:hypothetical protein